MGNINLTILLEVLFLSIGVVLLLIIGVIIYLGTAQRILDRLYLTDTLAILIVIAIAVGSFYNINLSQNPTISINIGGAVIPVILAIYVFSKIDNFAELIRTILATAGTAAGIYFITRLFSNFGHGRDIIDPMYVFAIIGGLLAYIFGRSRRGAFIAGSIGFLSYNLINVWKAYTGKVTTSIIIGGAGFFDSIIISGFLGLMLAELIGETRESLQGGPENEGRNDNEN